MWNARKTHCPNDHPYDEVWTYPSGRQWRTCRQCRLARSREYMRERRARERLEKGILPKEPTRLPIKDREACWEWPKTRDSRGYGRTKAQKNGWGNIYVHRLAHEWFIGPIPEGLTIDHLCGNKACFNPKHLEAVTGKENILRSNSLGAINARKTHCPKGHPYDVLLGAKQRRGCRQCNQQNRRERRVKARERQRAA